MHDNGKLPFSVSRLQPKKLQLKNLKYFIIIKSIDMKFLSKFTFIVLALGCIVAFSSCEKDEDEPELTCYKCDAYEVGGTPFPEQTFCEGDEDSGVILTEESLQTLVDGLAGVTTCTLQ